MALRLLFITTLLLVPVLGHAEIVSIMLHTSGQDGMLVEAAMKRQLREEGYIVRTGTADGLVLMLNVIAPENMKGQHLGYVGQITLVTSDWQKIGDMFVGEQCKESHTTAQEVKGMVGAPLILIDTAMGAASNPDDLANMLITSINPSIRKSFQTMQSFFTKLDQAIKTKQQGEVINPMR